MRLMPGLQELALQCSSEECDTLLNFDVKQLEGLKQLRVLRIQGINMPVDPHDFWPLWAAEKLVQASQYTLQVYVDCELDLTCYQAYSWPGDSEEAVAREEEKAESDIIEKLAWCTELSDLLGGGVLVTDLKVARLPDRLLSSTTTTSDGGMEGRLEAAQQQQQRTERHQEWLEQHRRRHARSRQGEGQEQGGGDGEEDGEGLLVQIDNVAFAQLAFPWEDPESRQQRLQLARRALRSVQKLDLSEFEKVRAGFAFEGRGAGVLQARLQPCLLLRATLWGRSSQRAPHGNGPHAPMHASMICMCSGLRNHTHPSSIHRSPSRRCSYCSCAPA